MKKFSILLFLSGVLGWGIAPDQVFNYRFTNRLGEPTDGISVYNGATRTIPISNSNIGCIGWQLTYNSEGFSVVSLNLQTNTKEWKGGLVFGPGNSWSTFGGTATAGTLPMTGTSQGNYTGYGYYPFVAVNLATATGTGSIDVVLSCWKSINYAGVSSGGGGGGGTVSVTEIAKAAIVPVSSSSSTAYAGTPVNPPSTYFTGQVFFFLPDVTNSTSTPTLNVNSIGAKTIVHLDSSALTASELSTSLTCEVYYDGTNMVLVDGRCLTGPGQITITSKNSSDVGNPTSGDVTLFFDALNSNHFSTKTSAGLVTDFQSTPFVTLTDGATVTWAIGSAMVSNAGLTFTTHGGSRTLNITNPLDGGSYVLWIKQDGTGPEGLTLGTGCTWKVSGGGGGAITPSIAANAEDVLAFIYKGTTCYANFNKNFN